MHVNVAMQWTWYTRVIDMPYWQQRLVLPKSNTHCKLKSIQSTCLSSLAKFHTLLQQNRSSTKPFMSSFRESMNSFFLNIFYGWQYANFCKKLFWYQYPLQSSTHISFLTVICFSECQKIFSDCDVLGFYYWEISVITHHHKLFVTLQEVQYILTMSDNSDSVLQHISLF